MKVFIGTKNDTSKLATASDLRVTVGPNVAHESIDSSANPILFRAVGMPPQAAIEFLLLSSAVYTVDKKTLRSSFPDHWTREFEVFFPSSKPALWHPIIRDLEATLSFLTGDIWKIEVRSEAVEFAGKHTRKMNGVDAISLFSGGLDSAIGALNLVEAGKRPLLLGHYDSPHTASDQYSVWRRLRELYAAEKVPPLVQVRVRPMPDSPYLGADAERTTRSRSVLFLGLGMAAASALSGDTPLIIPENGFISVNSPMDSSRLGSCSTRTTHPFFLASLRRIFQALGITNPIKNPFQFSTKGEIVKNCRAQTELRKIARITMSCAHPEAGRWRRQTYGACGYCYPCIIRRAALHHAGMDDAGSYLIDIKKGLAPGTSDTVAADVKAVSSVVTEQFSDRQKNTLKHILRSGPISDHGQIPALVEMYRRGLREIRTFFENDGATFKKSVGS